MILFALVLVMSISSISAVWDEARSSLYLGVYRAWLTAEGAGKISVVVDVQAVTTMDEVGASMIELFESADGGRTWNSVRMYFKSIHPEMVVEDDYWYYDAPVEYQGIVGRKYFACVTVYAADHTGYDEKEYNTSIVTARN